MITLMGPEPLRVVIAEDSVLLREGLARLISESGGTVVAAVGDGPSLVAAVQAHRPDVSVVDVRMPPTQREEGLRAAIEARRLVPGSPVLVLSQYVERQGSPDGGSWRHHGSDGTGEQHLALSGEEPSRDRAPRLVRRSQNRTRRPPTRHRDAWPRPGPRPDEAFRP